MASSRTALLFFGGNGNAPGGSGGGNTPVPQVKSLTASGFIDPNSAAVTLDTVTIEPPDPIGTFKGCELRIEIPDVSSTPALTAGTTPIGSQATVSAAWITIPLGKFDYNGNPWTNITFPAPPSIDPTKDTPARLYAQEYASDGSENPLVQANQANPTTNDAFSIKSLASGSPTSGTNVTTLTGGDGSPIGIVATALAPDNSTGKLLTPVIVDLTDTPAKPPGWVARLVLTVGTADATDPAKQQVVSKNVITQAGPVYQTGDGIAVAHSFTVPTPTQLTTATVWLQAGMVDASGKYTWNNIVPGITPQFSITYGSTVGTLDASAILTASINSSMAIVNSLFGVATGGITNSFLGPGAVATINVQNLAITNPLLAALAVQAANLATGSVTATAIAAAAVGTAAIQNAAITNALIANLAVSGAQIQNATITSTQIASATIAGANIASATITQANMASASIGTAQIQSLAVTDAKINDLSVSKLTAGSITATISITAATITGSTVVLNLNGITTNLNNTVVGGGATSVINASDNSTGFTTVQLESFNHLGNVYGSFTLVGSDGVHSSSAGLSAHPGSGTTQLSLTDQAGTAIFSPNSVRVDGLPSSSPGAGTKQFWYDPSDSNRLKFAA